MRCVGHQTAIGIKQRTGEVEAFFYVYRIRRVSKCGTHLFGNVHVQVVENFKHHRVGVGTNRNTGFQCYCAGKTQLMITVYRCTPAGLNDSGCC